MTILAQGGSLALLRELYLTFAFDFQHHVKACGQLGCPVCHSATRTVVHCRFPGSGAVASSIHRRPTSDRLTDAQIALRDDYWERIKGLMPGRLNRLRLGRLHSTVYNRFNSWSKKGIWADTLGKLTAYDATDVQCIDKAHRCEGSGRTRHSGHRRGGRIVKIHTVVGGDGQVTASQLTGGNRHEIHPAGLIERLPPAQSLLADAAYGSYAFRAFLTGRGTTPVIKRHPFDKAVYKGRNVIKRALSHLKDWRWIETRYDKLASTSVQPSSSPRSCSGGPFEPRA